MTPYQIPIERAPLSRLTNILNKRIKISFKWLSDWLSRQPLFVQQFINNTSVSRQFDFDIRAPGPFEKRTYATINFKRVVEHLWCWRRDGHISLPTCVAIECFTMTSYQPANEPETPLYSRKSDKIAVSSTRSTFRVTHPLSRPSGREMTSRVTTAELRPASWWVCHVTTTCLRHCERMTSLMWMR
jgi:hypothetical protein